MNKLKNFFSLIYLEIKKIARNKILLIFLFVFPFVMTFTLNSINSTAMGNLRPQDEFEDSVEEEDEEPQSDFAVIYINGTIDENSESYQMISDFININSFVQTQTQEEALNYVKTGQSYFYIYFDASVEPIKITMFYDSSSIISERIVDELRKQQIEYTYQSLTEFLADYGITINQDYFNFLSFESIQDFNINQRKRLMPLTASFIAVILMFGLSYTISRDNETNVLKQISYTPTSINKYLMLKAIPLFVLGFLQAILMLFLGSVMYGINYQTNVMLIFLFYIIFVLANLSLGMVFASIKNQTTSNFATIFAIMLPLLAVSIISLNQYPAFVQIILSFFPLTPFIQLFSYATFNGVVLGQFVIILLVQIVAYYILAYLLARKRTRAK